MTGQRFPLVALVSAAILACAVSSGCAGAGPSDAGRLTLAWVVDPCWSQVPVAADLGYFTGAGVKVKVVPFPTGAAALEALVGGAVDVASGGDVPTAAAALKNTRLRIVADGSRWDGGRFIARKSAGVNSIADLAGRRIAVPLGSSAHYFATKFLSQAGFAASAINSQLIQTGPGEIPSAIANHDVDVVAVFQPELAKAVDELHGDSVELQGSPKYNQHSMYLANENTVATKKLELSKFLEAIHRADGPLSAQDPAAVSAVARAMKLDERLVTGVLREFVFRTDLGSDLPADLADRAHWAQALGRIPGDAVLPDYRSIIDPAPLRGAQ
ncbi:ABC transporter substrate-binding protein [Mycobacterium arosiense]|uniref:Solute-binding protein family 3/N-terminal domain-containing protein n=1 Tax=Mycobacterium arosiense ATCC BAA-1401 = DSM 45069 TaxID=1265311 RepID=A0A1W9ZJV6_MYCAI|nr:ABC transporter substrate-binding protein [Mycobacterium arosiense]ORA17161.1 hypothetical protein BST14_09120 [Mycobacterium arosiense ATCC BAA-1401 = DSM 45069]